MKHILVVDDDRVFAEAMARSLQRRGWQAHVALKIDEACAQARQWQPRHAVIDLKIDQESGLALLPLLQELVPGIRVLILTGYSSITTAVAAIKLGAENYVCKPANADEVLQAFSNEKSQAAGVLLPQHPPSVRRLQWEHVQKVLDEHKGNISSTARALGMHRRSLQRILQKKPVGR